MVITPDVLNFMKDNRKNVAVKRNPIISLAGHNGISNLLIYRDNLRGFFEQCFSLLLKQAFGYEGSSWLNSIAKVMHSPLL